MYSRFHVKQVACSHISVALAVTVALHEKFVLGPGHVNPLRPSISFVIDGVRRCVSVMDELGLHTKDKPQRSRCREEKMPRIK